MIVQSTGLGALTLVFILQIQSSFTLLRPLACLVLENSGAAEIWDIFRIKYFAMIPRARSSSFAHRKVMPSKK